MEVLHLADVFIENFPLRNFSITILNTKTPCPRYKLQIVTTEFLIFTQSVWLENNIMLNSVSFYNNTTFIVCTACYSRKYLNKEKTNWLYSRPSRRIHMNNKYLDNKLFHYFSMYI